jgi:hypothetical protein
MIALTRKPIDVSARMDAWPPAGVLRGCRRPTETCHEKIPSVTSVNFPDPWESIPAERHLDFAVIREPLEKLAAATILNVERALPPEIANALGAPAVLLLLAKSAETMFSTIRYFCAEKPADPARRVSFASSAPPLLRSMLDEIITVIFIGEDIPGRVLWYSKAGWRELREEYDRHVQRYAGKPGWDAWLEKFGKFLDVMQAQFGITAAEAANPRAIPWWPTPTRMITARTLGADAQTFVEYMRDWFYREFSQEDHLSLPGLIRRGSNFLQPPNEVRTENTWKKLRSDWVTYAIVLFLAFLTEIVLLCKFDLRAQCAYLWGILKEYSPIAAEVFEARYEARLRA